MSPARVPSAARDETWMTLNMSGDMSGSRCKGHTARGCFSFNISHSIKPISRLDFPAHPGHWLLIYPHCQSNPPFNDPTARWSFVFSMSMIHRGQLPSRMNYSLPRGRDFSPLTKLVWIVQTLHLWRRRTATKANLKPLPGWTKSGRYLGLSTLSINNGWKKKKHLKYFPPGLEEAEKQFPQWTGRAGMANQKETN